MSEFNKEISEINKKTDIPINPNVHNLKNTMCFKTWNDMVISLPMRTVKWCCKTSYTAEQEKQLTFDLKTLEERGVDFFTNHPILQQRKYDLSGGTRSPDCVGCWKTEDVSGSSVRTEYNSNFDPLWKHRFNVASNHPKKSINFHQSLQKHDGMRFIELELTNKCNMACAYCWEGSSTRWQKETGRRMPDTDDAIFTKVIDILNEYWEGDLGKSDYVNFSLLGGEPFFTNHMYEFLEDFIVNLNNTKLKYTPSNKILLFTGFRSICPVTAQPDFANIYIVTESKIDITWLNNFLISYKDKGDFHEQCIEGIFSEINTKYKPKNLDIVGRFMRRGDIDINPVRSLNKKPFFKNFRFFNQ